MPNSNEPVDRLTESFRKSVSKAIKKNYGTFATFQDSEFIKEEYQTIATWTGEVHEYSLNRPVPTIYGKPPSTACFVIFWTDINEPMVSFYLKSETIKTKIDAVHALIARHYTEHTNENEAIE